MQRDVSGIDRPSLIQWINAEYHLNITALTFLPKGEVAYNYFATDRDNHHYFVRAAAPADHRSLEAAFRVTNALRHQCNMRAVVAPYANRRGTFTIQLNEFSIALFPFVEGLTALETPLSDDGLTRVAGVISDVHQSIGQLTQLSPPSETFDNPFEEAIRRALSVSAGPVTSSHEFRRRVVDLLQAQRADILATLNKMTRLRTVLTALDLERALTHGDPNLANILVDSHGDLHVVDWDDVAIGPLERDLMFFTGPGFEPFLRQYLVFRGEKPRLHQSAFEFYLYRWGVQEIANYTTRILFGKSDPEEDRYAWDQLIPYLPIDHASIASGLGEIRAVIERVQGIELSH